MVIIVLCGNGFNNGVTHFVTAAIVAGDAGQEKPVDDRLVDNGVEPGHRASISNEEETSDGVDENEGKPSQLAMVGMASG
jgi:hypothetical protein